MFTCSIVLCALCFAFERVSAQARPYLTPKWYRSIVGDRSSLRQVVEPLTANHIEREIRILTWRTKIQLKRERKREKNERNTFREVVVGVSNEFHFEMLREWRDSLETQRQSRASLIKLKFTRLMLCSPVSRYTTLIQASCYQNVEVNEKRKQHRLNYFAWNYDKFSAFRFWNIFFFLGNIFFPTQRNIHTENRGEKNTRDVAIYEEDISEDFRTVDTEEDLLIPIIHF